MPAFTDCKNREWTLRLTVGLMTDVRECAGVRLGDVLRDEAALGALVFGDAEALVKTLWVLCREQAEARGVTPEEFAHGFDGPTLEKAVEAFLGSVADFFPRSRVGQKMRENLPAILADADRRGVEAVEAAVRRSATSNGPGTNSAASAGSTPGR